MFRDASADELLELQTLFEGLRKPEAASKHVRYLRMSEAAFRERVRSLFNNDEFLCAVNRSWYKLLLVDEVIGSVESDDSGLLNHCLLSFSMNVTSMWLSCEELGAKWKLPLNYVALLLLSTRRLSSSASTFVV